MTQEELKIVIQEAIKSIENESPRLPLERNVGERTIVGRFAFHLIKHFSGTDLSVDVEYNVDPAGDRKWLDTCKELSKAAKDVKRRVYEDGRIAVVPDIIIHKRGTHEKNLAVIEVKFSDAGEKESSYAILKISAFKKQPFKYTFGILVSIPRTWQQFSVNSQIQFI